MKKLSQSDIRSAKAAVSYFSIIGILLGTIRQSNLLYVASITRFGIDREKASFPFFLCYTTDILSGPVIGYLGEKCGFKIVIVLGCLFSFFSVNGCFFAEDIQTITILWGVAYGFSYAMSTALLPQVLSFHFSSHFNKAIGISIGSECITSFFLILLTKYLLNNYGFSGTFLILSGVVLHSVPAAIFLEIPSQKKRQNKVSSSESVLEYDRDDLRENPTLFAGQLELKTVQDKCNANKEATAAISTKPKYSFHGFHVFLNPTYLLLLLIQSFYAYISTSINTMLVDVIRDHDISIDDAVYVLNSFQVSDAIGRFTLGFFTDRGYLSKANFSAVCFFGIGLLLVAFIWLRCFICMIVFVVGIGLCSGGLVMISACFVMQYVEKDCFSVAIPSRYLLYVPISFTQAPLIGFFRDKLRSYDGLLYILVAICCVSGIFSMMVPSLERCRRKRNRGFQADQETR